MSSASSTKLMTADELLERSSELGRCELIRGELIMMSPAGGNHGHLAYELGRQIGNHVVQNKLGKVFAAETGFRLGGTPDTVRAPDVAFIATPRLAEARTPQFIPIPPDLAVEVNSPNDRASDVSKKVSWWLSHGTKAVWVCDPASQTITTFLPDGSARVWQLDQTLDAGEVLPGFTLPLSELFAE